MELSARQADVHLGWIEPIEQTARRLDSLKEHFRKSGRQPVFGIRSHLIVRETEEEAWDAAHELIAHADPRVKAQRQSVAQGSTMVGVRAQAREAPDHRLGPHLWNGLSEVRVNCGSALVGTPEQVSDELLAYWKLGLDEFILSGFPHVEECRRVAGEVLPLLREKIAAVNPAV
jgi:alkanesulfonate monooxygenase